jgi:HK97 family phage major capsid protein
MELTRKVDDAPDEYTVTKWQPYEVSLTAIPADISVGVGRSEKMATTEDEVEPVKPKPEPEPKKKPKPKPKKEETTMSDEKKTDIAEVQAQARKDELHRVREIQALGDVHKMNENARSAVNNGKSVEEFRAEVLDAIASKPVSIETEIGMTPKEQRNYSMLRAVNAVVTGNWSGAELEREASDEVAKRVGKDAQGFFVPMDIQRDVTTASGSGSGAIGTDNLGDSFIDLLRNSLKVKELGATVLGGLVGNVTIPALTTGNASYWVDENSAPTEGAPVVGQVALNPSTVGAYVDLSRRFLAQSSFDAEAMFKNDLALSLATKIDLACINGSGTSPEPTGILNTTGIGAVDFTAEGAPTYAEIVNVWEEVANDNGLTGSPAFLTNATLAGALMSTDSFSSAGLPILKDGKILGYDCAVSGNVPAHHIIFGNWNDLVIGEWGAIDIAVDKTSLSTTGAVRVVALHDVGIALRHASSFAHGD